MKSKSNKSSGISMGYILLGIIVSSLYDILAIAGGSLPLQNYVLGVVIKTAIVAVIIALIENVSKP